ncbi:MAG: T9SS type A sorting domain-containing protein [bacterium]|nr:MAG: T9SS type A sorting domain-containing protein [bacterium]
MLKRITIITVLGFFSLLALTKTSHAWIENGDSICAETDAQSDPLIVPDGFGGSIICWCDNSGADADIRVQRVNERGRALWDWAGVTVCDTVGDQTQPQIIPDGSGGAFVVWTDNRRGNLDIFVQHFDPYGARLWGPDIEKNGRSACVQYQKQELPSIAPDNNNGVIIAWVDQRNSNSTYSQRLNGSGSEVWPHNGVHIHNDEGYPITIHDGLGGAFICHRNNTWGNIRVTRIDPDGVVRWTSDVGSGNQYRMIYGGNLCVILTWINVYYGNTRVLARKVAINGTLTWPEIIVYSSATDRQFPELTTDGQGGAIITWQDDRNGDWDIYAQRIDSESALKWNPEGEPVCTAMLEQELPAIAPDGQGGAFIVWRDGRSGSYDIYFNCIDSLGAICPENTNGKPVCTAGGTQTTPFVASPLADSATVAWADSRPIGSSAFNTYVAMVQNGPCECVSTILKSHACDLRGTSVELRWLLSQAGREMRFSVSRAEGINDTFLPIANPGITRDGLSFTFNDPHLVPSRTYRYRVDVEDEKGGRILFETQPVSIPSMPLALFQNEPNPFNPSTTIRYLLPGRAPVALEIFGVSGRLITNLVNETQEPGSYTIHWNGTDSGGRTVASGLYFYRLRAGKEIASRKMLLVR